jgi:hypothetical protein
MRNADMRFLDILFSTFWASGLSTGNEAVTGQWRHLAFKRCAQLISISSYLVHIRNRKPQSRVDVD